MENHGLMHSMSEFSSVIFPILEVIKANAVCALSASDIKNLKFLHRCVSQRQGKLVVLDPNCTKDSEEWLVSANNAVAHISESSINGIAKMPPMDAWFLHGNPNWFTVYSELLAIYDVSKRNHKPMMAFIQNVAWPCARRDWYAHPENIPESFRKAYSWDSDITKDAVNLMNSRENKKYAYAMTDGGERNGVLTAVEDFVVQHADEFFWCLVPGVFGLGILFAKNHPYATEIAKFVAPYHLHPLLANLEENRVANFLAAYKSRFESAMIDDIQQDDDMGSENFSEMELSVKRLVTMLEDEADHPEIWNIFKISAESESKDSLIALANYIDQLLDKPQPQKIVRLLTIAHAVCAAYVGNTLFAHKKLEELTNYYPGCSLLQGALQRVKELEEACHS